MALKRQTKKHPVRERRRHLREARVLTIEYRLYKRRGILINGSWSVSTTKNMSLVGVLFTSDINFKLADILEARVVMCGLDVFRGFARVVRVEEPKKGLPYRVAVTFVDQKSKLL